MLGDIALNFFWNFRRNDNFGDTGWPFPVVAAYLRLGSKYEIEHLHTEAMDVLSAGFPSTLEENDVENYNDGVGPLVFEKSMYFDVISLARETGIHRLLPAAYCYYCEMFVLDEVLEGIERVDGTLSVLSAQDQKVLMRGWHTLVRLQSVETFYWMTDVEHDDSDVFAGCETTASGKCALARRDIMCEEMFPMRSDCVALRCWDSLWETRMCKACIAVCTDIHDEGRARIWDKLPSVFGLPAWNELFQA
jgi:hypothetical protein